ncbi:MAG TPA: hypothetical protein VL486_11825 [Verrucomicrobiae bacterium]|nr:hypothetical protein [Verrucomicrobiae bacterium]
MAQDITFCCFRLIAMQAKELLVCTTEHLGVPRDLASAKLPPSYGPISWNYHGSTFAGTQAASSLRPV